MLAGSGTSDLASTCAAPKLPRSVTQETRSETIFQNLADSEIFQIICSRMILALLRFYYHILDFSYTETSCIVVAADFVVIMRLH